MMISSTAPIRARSLSLHSLNAYHHSYADVSAVEAGSFFSGLSYGSCVPGSASINRQFEPVWLALDDTHVLGVESTDPNDPVPVTDIAVVENQIARGSVIADVVDLGVVAGGNPVHGQRPGEVGNLLDPGEVREPQSQGELIDQVAGSGIVGELSSEGLITDGDPDICHGGLLNC